MIHIEQRSFSPEKGWRVIRAGKTPPANANLVLVFGSTELLRNRKYYDELRETYPDAEIVLNSTAGEIADIEVSDNSLSVTAMHFEKTKIKTIEIDIKDPKDSFKAGYRLASSFEQDGLSNIIVISDGLKVNGTDLVSGLAEFLPENIIITGGLRATVRHSTQHLLASIIPRRKVKLLGSDFTERAFLLLTAV